MAIFNQLSYSPQKNHSSPSHSAIYLTFCLLLILLSVLSLTGCATVPRMEEVYQRLDTEKEKNPKIIGPRGELSPQISQRVMERLRKEEGSTDILDRHVALVESISDSQLVAGNKVTLLIDGPATYGAMFKAIENAKDHIHLETYVFEDGEMGQRFADLLIKKRSEGVQVNVIYDSLGCLHIPSAFFQRMRDSGINALEFNPLNPAKAREKWILAYRDHRKILILDGKVAFTGGVNISEVYASSSSSPGRKKDMLKEAWRDTDIRIEGPAVAALQKLFLETWERQKGPDLPKKDYFPPLKREGNNLLLIVGNTPGDENRITYIMYVSAFSYAEKSIHLTSSYFVPDKQTIKALTRAAQRGVDVKIILPETSDEPLVLYAGRFHYSRLLKSGVKLYLIRDVMIHAKTAIIDSVWSTVGSTNLDLWSFIRDDEVNAIILGRDFAMEMQAQFEKDLANSSQIYLETWKKRPIGERLREWLSRLLQYWL